MREASSKGGKIAAANMTAEQRKERSMKAVEAKRALSALPRATHGTSDRPLRLGDIAIPCYVLSDGRRVLHHRGMVSALGMSRGGSSKGGGDRLVHFVGQKTLEPYISNNLLDVTANPIMFKAPNGSIAYGYEAQILADICDAVLEARKNDKLQKQQQHIADQCELLLRGFARVGIIALVDEATGYQDVRARDELNVILQAYIASELLPWTKRFPDEFYKQIFRLHGWAFDPNSTKRPAYVGKLTNQLVYDQMPTEVVNELKRLNPPNVNGNRNHRFHQFLSTQIGNPHLEKHVTTVTTLMKISDTLDDFRKLFNKAFPAGPIPELIED